MIGLGSPPPYPGDNPKSDNPSIQQKWIQQRNEFAYYYLALFRPEPANYDGTIDCLSYTFQDLAGWMQNLAFNEFLTDYFRLEMVQQQMFTAYSASVTRDIIGAYRNQSVTKCAADEQSRASTYFQDHAEATRPSALLEDMYVLSVNEELSPQALQACQRHSQYCTDQIKKLQYINPIQSINHPHQVSSNCHRIQFKHEEDINQLNIDLSKAILSDANDVHQTAENFMNFIEHDVDILEQRMEDSTLSVDQKPIIKDLFHILLKQKYNMPTKQFLGLLTGEPGTGKTFIIRTILKYNDEDFNTGSIITSAYNGITAVAIDGQTLCSLFHIQSSQKTTEKKVKPLASDQLN